VRRDDALQTAINLVLGIRAFLDGSTAAMPSQVEYAVQSRPTVALVELGFVEVLEAAVAGNADLIPNTGAFRSDFAELVRALRALDCEVIALNIPDPLDTAHFSPVEAAARVLKVPAPMVAGAYGLQPDDRIAVEGLTEMGYQLFSKSIGPLPPGVILRGAVAADISARTARLNEEIAAVMQEQGGFLYDLHALFHGIRESGVSVGTRRLTADFLGGFYSLDGYYPGKTGQALIANGVLELLNRTYETAYKPVDLEKVIQLDPVAMYRQAEGPDFTPADLAPPAAGSAQAGSPPQPAIPEPVPTTPGSAGVEEPGRLPLVLPPGLEQVLPLNKEASYYGDALRAVHTADPAEALYGLTGNLLFGGLAMLDSHLSGSIRIKFSPP
jgi:hypothetical protein